VQSGPPFDQSQAYIPPEVTSQDRLKTHAGSRQRRRQSTTYIPPEQNEAPRMNPPHQRARTRRESRESELARMQHAPSSGPIRTRGNTSYVVLFYFLSYDELLISFIRRERIEQQGVGDNHGSLVHNALDHHFTTPGLTSDSYLAQSPAQLASYDPVEVQGLNQQSNQPADHRPVMEHRRPPILDSFGSQNNSQHDATRVYQAAHAFGPLQTSQPMSLHEPSAPGLVSLPGVSELRYGVHRQPGETVPPYVTGLPAGYASEHYQQLDPHRRRQYSQGDYVASYERQDGYPSQQQGDGWRQAERMPDNNDAVHPESYQLGHPSQFQQAERWHSQGPSASTSNVPLYAANQVSIAAMSFPEWQMNSS
jgi:hypothetical protein